MSDLAALPPLREVIKRHGLQADRSLGQNFLLDLNLTGRMARQGGPLAATHIIEIGPGPGGLTRSLLLEGAERVTVIEKDPRMISALTEIAATVPGRLTILEEDALSTDYEKLAAGPPVRIVANLPYNIATPLLAKFLSQTDHPPWWSSLTLMFQREVAERITAKPGTKTYGRISVLAGIRANSRILFTIPPKAFVPPPNVTSAVVRLDPKPDVELERSDIHALERVTAAAFGQRRKMLRTSLKQVWPNAEQVLHDLGINPQWRAENVDPPGYAKLAMAYLAGAT